MQTFMPYSTFADSVACLDNKRLGKQRVEGKQIVDILEGRQTSWRNHPAVRMWHGYNSALKLYVNASIQEWIKRGFRNTIELYNVNIDEISYPDWLCDELVHISHRANLLLKDFAFYSQFGWDVEPHGGYFWPRGAIGKKAKADIEFWLNFNKTENKKRGIYV